MSKLFLQKCKVLDILHYNFHIIKFFLYAQSLEKESYRCILPDKKSLLWLKMMKGENEKKLRERLCHCFGEKEQQFVISPQIALLNSLLLKRLQIMMLRTPSALVDEYFIFSFSTIVGDKKKLTCFFIETFWKVTHSHCWHIWTKPISSCE